MHLHPLAAGARWASPDLQEPATVHDQRQMWIAWVVEGRWAMGQRDSLQQARDSERRPCSS